MKHLVWPLLLPSLALAAPSAEIVEKIRAAYDPAIRIVEKESSGSGPCRVTGFDLEGKDPVTGETRSVHVKLYEKRGLKDTAAAVIVLPPTGGVNRLDTGNSEMLCENGFRALLLESWDHDLDVTLDMGMHDQGALRALAAVGHTVEFLQTRGNGRIGILGTSVGAITSALVLGWEPRIETGVLITAGGGMAEIIARSTEENLTKLRARRFEAFGFRNEDEYLGALKEKVTIDPLDFAGFSGAKKVLMVVALEDTTVPTKNQRDLQAVLHPERVIEFHSAHVGAIVKAYLFHQGTIRRFFETNL